MCSHKTGLGVVMFKFSVSHQNMHLWALEVLHFHPPPTKESTLFCTFCMKLEVERTSAWTLDTGVKGLPLSPILSQVRFLPSSFHKGQETQEQNSHSFCHCVTGNKVKMNCSFFALGLLEAPQGPLGQTLLKNHCSLASLVVKPPQGISVCPN